ncbi:helix-turn-helix domain-containing protein [Chloroflexota bacterium]
MALKDEYLTISQGAKELGVTRQTISRWIKEGKIPAEKIGRETIIEREALRKYQIKSLIKSTNDSIIGLVQAVQQHYYREKGCLEADERLMGVSPGKERTIIARKPDGTRRLVKVSSKQFNESYERVKPILEAFLKGLDINVLKVINSEEGKTK